MKAHKLAIFGISLVLVLGLMIGCSDNSLNPQSQVPNTTNLLNANQDYFDQVETLTQENQGLSRGWLLQDTKYVRADRGAVLGGWRTLWNYVEIPPNTLLEDQVLSFSVGITGEGALVFSVGRPQARESHVEFQEGKTATLMVSKRWLNEAPEYIINYDDQSEEYSTSGETPEFYLAKVPHFSRWAWGWETY